MLFSSAWFFVLVLLPQEEPQDSKSRSNAVTRTALDLSIAPIRFSFGNGSSRAELIPAVRTLWMSMMTG